MILSTSSRSACQRLHVKIVPLNLSRFQVSRPAFISTIVRPAAKIPFNQSTTSVRINDKDDGEEFICDEELHMLSPMLGHGYYPISLGQKLGDGKFEIVRKLGWATNSSVWLARTLGSPYPTKYVAVKVLTVNATLCVVDGYIPDERKNLNAIQAAKRSHPGYKHCLQLYDVFIEKSYHGPHICFVTNVLGSHMNSLRRRQLNGHAFPAATAKRIVKQTLLALDYLHRECGLVHTDVKPDNTLVLIGNQDAAISQFLQENPSTNYEPRIEPDLSPDPIITVRSQPLPNFGLKEDASNLDVCLIDLGSATPAKQNLEQAQPVLLRAPELILGHPWSTPIDIWSVGCLTFEYLVGTSLMQLWESSAMTLEQVHLQRIFEFSGRFPDSFLEACKRRTDFFDEQGSLLRVDKLAPAVMDDVLRAYHVNEQDIAPAAAFIRKCVTIDPRVRPTALELLDDEWLMDT
ncbi:kinase-like domain-containing protein [Gautieria morchelliformis]|nr:kinase-like domain-containing protein [Gautieria morchelliformis]